MLPEQISQFDLLDILFADRNKSYGAYPLRRQYNKRLWTAIAVTGGITALALAGYYSSGNEPYKGNVMNVRDSTILVSIEPPDEVEPPAPPPPPPPPPQVSMRRFTDQFTIVSDDQVTDVPPVEELETARIGNINVEGINDNIVAPPVEDSRGIVEVPRHTEDEDKVFIKVEKESEYPGGLEAWKRFLLKTLRYPSDAVEKDIYGTVVVEFIVDREGKVSNVKAVSGPEELMSEAIRVIGKSGKWTVAIQNGNPVKSLKRQSIIFRLANE